MSEIWITILLDHSRQYLNGFIIHSNSHAHRVLHIDDLQTKCLHSLLHFLTALIHTGCFSRQFTRAIEAQYKMDIRIASEVTEHDIGEGFPNGETNHASNREERLDGLFANGEGHSACFGTVVFRDDSHVCNRQVEWSTALGCEWDIHG